MTRVAYRSVAISLALALSVVVLTFTAPRADAWVSPGLWDPGYIISDQQFYDGNAMSAAQIQDFLNAKVPTCHPERSEGPNDPIVCLKDYRMDTISRAADAYCPNPYVGASNETAATIIYKVAQACNISPKVILVTLQKENTLVTHDWPSAWRYKSAMGYACPDDGTGCNPDYSGFQNQVWRAARQFQLYAAKPTGYGYRAGLNNLIQYKPNSTCGTQTVFIRNTATAGLYNYTPYVPNAAALTAMPGNGDVCSSYGNRNFWMYFWEWFGDPTASVMVANLTPASGSIDGGTSVTLTGGGFTGTTQVTFDGVAGTSLIVVSDTQIFVRPPAHAAGVVDVVVSGPIGHSIATTFTYVPPVSPSAAPDPSSIATVYRFWSPKNKSHFYTMSVAERDQIIRDFPPSEWTYEGGNYNAFSSQQPGTVPLYRFWSSKFKGHFYTTSEEEKDQVIANYDDETWLFEGIAYYVYPAEPALVDTLTVARFWSQDNKHHFYTASAVERDQVIAIYPRHEWAFESDAFRVPSSPVVEAPLP